MTLKAGSQCGLQGSLQLRSQRSRCLRFIQAKNPGTTRAFEMAMLMLDMTFMLAMVVTVDAVIAGAVAKHAVIAGYFVGQTGIGQAIQCTVQGDPVHCRHGVLYLEMRQGALAEQEFGQDIQACIGDTHTGLTQQVTGIAFPAGGWRA